jgi:hypothetical protein
MFSKLSICLLILSLGVIAAPAKNWDGLYDTSGISTFKADSLKFSRVYNLTDFENRVGIIQINDTTSAGYKVDSVKAETGYRLGLIVLNGNGALDTTWGELRAKDTINLLDSTKAIANANRYSDTGSVLGLYDTLNVTGFACQRIQFPSGIDWSVCIQFYIKGLTGNKKGQFIRTWFAFPRRLYHRQG